MGQVLNNLTYKEWKVDYDPTSDECIARGRTHRLLLEVSGLVEHTLRNSDRHNAILSAITTGKDHPSNLCIYSCSYDRT